jgi:hypothetical protein
MFEDLKLLPENWSKAFSSRTFRNQFFLTFLAFIAIGAHDFYFLRIWQARQGIQINDLILNQMPPIDFSVPIFIVEYTTLILVLLLTIPHPDRFVKGLQMFGLVTLTRTMTIYFIPLEPPRDMILLNDPMATFFLHTKDTVVTKDLFFSGHIAALSLLALIVENKYAKKWATVAIILVGIMIMWQHVHYSMDVFCAPVMSFICYRVVLYFHRETRYGLELSHEHW